MPAVLVLAVAVAVLPATGNAWSDHNIIITPGTPVEITVNSVHVILEANVTTFVSLTVDNNIRDKHFYANFSAAGHLQVTVTVQKDLPESQLVGGRDVPVVNANRFRYSFGAAFRIQANRTEARIRAGARVDSFQGRESKLRWIARPLDASSADPWSILPSTLDGEYLYASFSASGYFTIAEDIAGQIDEWVIWTVAIAGIVLAGAGLMVSKRDYLRGVVLKLGREKSYKHRLTFDEVVNHPKRAEILDLILEHPGIHLNELMRRTGLDSGAISWHLGVLDDFMLVKNQKIGNFMAYFPRLKLAEDLPLFIEAVTLMKVPTRLDLLRAIGKGHETRTDLATLLRVDKATVRRHAKDLANDGFITITDTAGKKISSITGAGKDVLATVDALLERPEA